MSTFTSSGFPVPTTLSWDDLRATLADLAIPWRAAEELPPAELRGVDGVTALQAQLLANRGIRGGASAHTFLHADWHEREPLPDQAQAVERLRQALESGERVVVYGDHDCDGITSCAVLLQTLRALGANADRYIPLREADGRGLNLDAIETLAKQGTRLIVTTDCGSANVAEVARAHALGMDVIITDHHPILSEKPSDCLIVNPRLAEQRSDSDDLSGAAVAFRLAEALARAVDPAGAETLLEGLLDLVAIGVIGDIVALSPQNWALARAGLARLRTQPRPGLRALLTKAGVYIEGLTERDITYVIAPRINAAARLGQPLIALDLLCATEAAEAERLATQLENLNLERQRKTEEIMALAQEQVAAQLALEDGASPLVSAIGEGWPLGMLGLVASRLAERYRRPAVVISRENNGEARGSARGPDGVNLGEALAERSETFLRFGGHARAAGFTLPASEVEGLLAHLRERLNAQRQGHGSGARADGELLLVDCRMPANRVIPRIYREQQALAPYGPAFAEPLYLCQSARLVNCWRSGAEGRNLRLKVRDATGEATFFWARQGDLCESLRVHIPRLTHLDLVYTLDAYTRSTGDLDLLARVASLKVIE